MRIRQVAVAVRRGARPLARCRRADREQAPAFRGVSEPVLSPAREAVPGAGEQMKNGPGGAGAVSVQRAGAVVASSARGTSRLQPDGIPRRRC